MKPVLPFLFALLVGTTSAQSGSVGQQLGAPFPPYERIDLSGDGIPDVVITGSTKHFPGPEPTGFHRRYVAPLPGTTFLMRTDQGAEFFRLRRGRSIAPDQLTKGIRVQNLRWSNVADSARFEVLVRGFGPGVYEGWYGSDHYTGDTLVYRTAMNGIPVIGAFWITQDVIGDTIGIGIGPHRAVEKGEPIALVPVNTVAPTTPTPDAFSFEYNYHREPTVMEPPGVPPDEDVDLTYDDIPEVVITGYTERFDGPTGTSGYYRRGVAPAPNTAILLERKPDASFGFFRLVDGTALTPVHLSMGLQSGSLRWAHPEKEKLLLIVLEHSFGLDHPDGWRPAREEHIGEAVTTFDDHVDGNMVYRTLVEGQPVIGVVEVSWSSPSGRLGVNQQTMVHEGEVLVVQ